MSRFDWYEVVSHQEPFEQGDFFNRVPIPIVTSGDDFAISGSDHDNPSSRVEVEMHNVVLMTQSCDLQKFKDSDHVLLCARLGYKDLSSKESTFRGKDGWVKLVNGRFTGSHLLNKCDIEGYQFDYQVVDLKRVFSVPIAMVKYYSRQQGSGRIRLLPPYREHLAQAFARQFMRIGLPIDLPKDPP